MIMSYYWELIETNDIFRWTTGNPNRTCSLFFVSIERFFLGENMSQISFIKVIVCISCQNNRVTFLPFLKM